MFSLANKLSLASLTFKPTPPVPERKVISSATSLDITRRDSPRDGGLETLTMPPPPPRTLTSLLLRAGSEEPLCRASHNRGRRGSRAPVYLLRPLPQPLPWRSVDIFQIRLQKNTVFICCLCKLRRWVSPFVSHGRVSFFFACFICVCASNWRASRNHHINRTICQSAERASWSSLNLRKFTVTSNDAC